MAVSACSAVRGYTPGMPQSQAALIGRAQELVEVREAFQGSTRLVTITGPGGIGKTTLARVAARKLDAQRVWFCGFSEATEPADLRGILAQASGVQPKSGLDASAIEGLIFRQLRGARSGVVVADNAEHVLESLSELLERALAMCVDLRVLVTSRERLRLPGEQVIELGPLSSADAIALFIARAQTARPGFVLSADDHQDAEHIASALHGMPLAIEIVANKASVLSVKAIAERLDRHLDLQAGHRFRGPERHRTLRAAIDWSWSLLEEDDRVALKCVSVFEGGFSCEAAESVLQSQVQDPLESIEALRQKSLIQAQALEDSTLRFGMFRSIKDYARERLGADSQSALQLHASYYAERGLALARALRGPEAVQAKAALRRERFNLMAVHRRGLAGKVSAKHALATSLALDPLFLSEASGPRHLELLDAALKLSPEEEPSLTARLCIARGRAMHRFGGDLELVFEDYDRAHRISKAVKSFALEAEALGAIAGARYMLGALKEALEIGERALELARRADHELEAALQINETGVTLHMLGRFEEAEARYLEALERRRALGDLDGLGRTLACLGFLHQDRGRTEEAERCYGEARAIQSGLGNKDVEGIILGYLGNLARRREEADAALVLYEKAQECLSQVGDSQFFAVVNMDRGLLLLEQRPELAKGALEDALAAFAIAPEPLCEALTRGALAVCAARQGDFGQARAQMHQAKALIEDDSGGSRAVVLELFGGVMELLQYGAGRVAKWRARLEALEPRTDYIFLAGRILKRALLQIEPPDGALIVGREVFRIVPGEEVSLVKRPTLARVLWALAEGWEDEDGEVLSAEVLFARAWPEERASAKAAQNRVRVALASLRKLGLRDVIQTVSGGYRFDPEVLVFLKG